MTAFFSAFSSSKLEKNPKKRGWSERCYTFPYIRIQVKEDDKRSVFMVKYMLIIEYLSKENNFSQVATLCIAFQFERRIISKVKKREMWLKSLGLDENKIIDDREK